MKPAEKETEMEKFVKGETQILVATTVIEVGVNVPNASVMVILDAQRFGLSQLHQLRGRVGRGSDQSYCILVTNYKLSEDTRKRIDIMCDTNDGFRIAEADLKLRGPGDLEGTQQSGIAFDLKIADIARDRSTRATGKTGGASCYRGPIRNAVFPIRTAMVEAQRAEENQHQLGCHQLAAAPINQTTQAININ